MLFKLRNQIDFKVQNSTYSLQGTTNLVRDSLCSQEHILWNSKQCFFDGFRTKRLMTESKTWVGLPSLVWNFNPIIRCWERDLTKQGGIHKLHWKIWAFFDHLPPLRWDILLYKCWQKVNIFGLPTSTTTYPPRLFNVVCERRLNIFISFCSHVIK